MGSMPQRATFRDFMPTADWKFKKQLADSDAKQWAELRERDDFVRTWKESWNKLYDAPFKGITTNGEVIPRLFHLAKNLEDYGAPTAAMVTAAENLLSCTTSDQREALCYPLDSPKWRRWMNPELYFFENGLRLEEHSDELVAAVHTLLRASLSPSGYTKAIGCMKVNDFLGEIVDGKKVLNERSYNVAIYGVPSLEAPWGWHIYGHHLCLNFLVVGTQEVVTPIFMGAEPNIIDEGPEKGTALFTAQEHAGIVLMRSLDTKARAQVQIYSQLKDPAMPEGRHHRADQRHLGGAFQDNRIVPYEGICVATLTQSQQDLVVDIIRLSIDYLPSRVQEARLSEIQARWTETHFCWIGGWEETDAFYYKIHSPVVMLEFDHHTGVFLTNKEPLPFHIHTLVRTPNGNDYGKELVRLYQQNQNADV